MAVEVGTVPTMNPTLAIGLFALTALAEIAGCYSIYAWLWIGKLGWWLLPGVMSLLIFGWLLSFHSGPAGRVHAAYGAVYISASILWMWGMEDQFPDRWDLISVAVCLPA